MAQNDIIAAIDDAVAALKSARKILVATSKSATRSPQAKTSAKKQAVKTAGAKRGLSEEGRQRIAEGQRKRWAVMKKAAKKAARAAAQ